MEHNIYIYIAVMALVTYAIRVLPLTLIRKEIKNPFIRSFFILCPIHDARSNDLSCYPAGNTNTCCRCSCPRVGVATAWRGMSLFHVACCCCAVVFIVEFIMVP